MVKEREAVTAQAAAAPRSSRARVAVGVALLAWIAGALWSFASPIGSVPDEPSHFIRAVVVARGEVISPQSTQNPAFGEAVVPASVAHVHEWTCYAFRADISAECMKPVRGDGEAEVETVTSAATNSPAYYALVGWPSLVLDGTPELYAMRIVNAALCALVLGVLAFYLPLVTRARWSWVALLAATTPMVAYLAGSVNPNGLEAVGSAAFFVAIVALLRARPRGRALVQLLGWLLVVTSLLLSTRNIAMLWMVVAIVVATQLAGWRAWLPVLKERMAWVGAAALAAVAIVTLAWYLNPPEYGANPFGGVGTSVPRAFFEMVVTTFGYAEGYIGLFGWVDTHSPEFSVIAYSVVLVGLILAAVAVSRGRALWAVVTSAGAVLLVPAVVQALLAPSVGFIWQGRYMLGLVMVAIITAGIVIDDALPRAEGASPSSAEFRVGTAVLLLVAGAHSASFLWALRRYVVGVDDGYTKMISAPEWQPVGTWQGLAIAYAVNVFASAALAWYFAFRPADRRRTSRQTAE